MQSIYSISPLDGRYIKATEELQQYFSEFALIKYRVMIECLYFLKLASYKEFGIDLTSGDVDFVKKIYLEFRESDALAVKEIEKTTNHDVKAVEYFIRNKIKDTPIAKYSEFVHFALTSEDINNLSFTLMYKNGVGSVLSPTLDDLVLQLSDLAKSNADTAMLSLTHGQTATPTTFGKEIAVFVYRLKRQIAYTKSQTFFGKFGGATGTWSAHVSAYPDFDWVGFAKEFVEELGLEFCPLTTQIVPADTLVESYDNFARINNILIDFARDVWMYVMRGILEQKNKPGEIGSSAMPHKINPINFENAEGNLQLANSLFKELGRQLPVSRMQRDLTGSTVIRNQGLPVGYSLIAYQNLIKGLGRISVNKTAMAIELDSHWEVLAEAIQTILRSINYPDPYTALKDLTKGQKITRESIKEFTEGLDVEQAIKGRIVGLTPQSYVGVSKDLASLI
jgi:adenylosuccinate lyase